MVIFAVCLGFVCWGLYGRRDFELEIGGQVVARFAANVFSMGSKLEKALREKGLEIDKSRPVVMRKLDSQLFQGRREIVWPVRGVTIRQPSSAPSTVIIRYQRW